MKALWYVGTFVLGLLGVLLLLRGIEVISTGGALTGSVFQLSAALLLLVGAWKSLLKARAA